MAVTKDRSLINRLIGVAKLDAATFEEIEHDGSATVPAVVIAALAGVSLAVGELLMDPIGWKVGEFAFFAFSFATVAIVGWILFTLITYAVGNLLFRADTTEGTWPELLRTLGFAGVPVIIGGWLTFIPFVDLAVLGWFLAAVVVAVRQSTDVNTGRAIAIALPGFIVLVVIQFALLFLIFRPG